MPLLSRFLRPNSSEDDPLPRLIDYEMLTDKNGKRTVGFGWFAGGESCPSHVIWLA
jgi:alpha-aminoadipic semialdehyde synthase